MQDIIFALIPILGITCGLVAIIGGVVIKPMLRMRERRIEIDAELARERLALDAARSERLEQRVAVLERILTDRSANLADEIERLREAPLN